jgi:peptidoglycan hydrolase CwlO-like protein
MFLVKEQDNKNLQEEIKHLNENINECQKRESSLKDRFEVVRHDKEKLITDTLFKD